MWSAARRRTRSEIPWPAGDRVVLVDTPGLAEVRGEVAGGRGGGGGEECRPRAVRRRWAARSRTRASCSKRSRRWRSGSSSASTRKIGTTREQRDELLRQIAEQVAPAVKVADVVAVRARPTKRRRVRVLSDGSEQDEEVPVEPDIGPLARRMMSIVERDGRDLLLANLLLQSRGLVDEAKERVLAALDERADEVINKYMWAAGGAAAINPFPLLDLAGGSAITVKMVLDLAGRVSAEDRRRYDRHAARPIGKESGRDGRRVGGRAGAGGGDWLAAEDGAGHRHDRGRRRFKDWCRRW